MVDLGEGADGVADPFGVDRSLHPLARHVSAHQHDVVVGAVHVEQVAAELLRLVGDPGVRRQLEVGDVRHRFRGERVPEHRGHVPALCQQQGRVQPGGDAGGEVLGEAGDLAEAQGAAEHQQPEGAPTGGQRHHQQLVETDRCGLDDELLGEQVALEEGGAGALVGGEHQLVREPSGDGLADRAGALVDPALHPGVGGQPVHATADQLPRAGVDDDLGDLDHLAQQLVDDGLDGALWVLDGAEGAGEPQQELRAARGLGEAGTGLHVSSVGEEPGLLCADRGRHPSSWWYPGPADRGRVVGRLDHAQSIRLGGGMMLHL